VLGVHRCRILPLEWMSNEVLLCSTVNKVWSLVTEHDNVSQRMYTCMCNWVTMLYSRKLTEHSKQALMKKRKNSLPKEKKREHFLTPCTKINSKWVKDLNIRPDTVKLLEENIGQTRSDINHSNLFSEPPPRVRSIKPKRNKWDLTKLKSFCTAKETTKQHKKTAHRIRAHICK